MSKQIALQYYSTIAIQCPVFSVVHEKGGGVFTSVTHILYKVQITHLRNAVKDFCADYASLLRKKF